MGLVGGLVAFGQRVGTGLAREAPKRSAIFYQYFKAEIAPPGPKEWPVVEKGFRNAFDVFYHQKWKEWTVKEMWRTTIVCVEVGCWFWVGEVIGRGTFVGYVIPSTFKNPFED